jgi:metal-sulfur cluster biosynthetic enzyme
MSDAKTLPGRAEVLELLKPVQDPELHLSLVDLGLIYGIELNAEKKSAVIEMSLTSPGCPAANDMIISVRKAVEASGYEDVEVKLVWEPKWDPQTMATDEVKDRLGIW